EIYTLSLHDALPISRAPLPTLQSTALITPRRGDAVHAAIAEDVRHEGGRTENFGEGEIADAQAAGIGAEGRHHEALPVGGETTPLHGTSARRHPRLGMQVPGDLAKRTGR